METADVVIIGAGIIGAAIAFELDTYPVTVRARYTGVELNMGMYSRLRAIDPDSSFSVMG